MAWAYSHCSREAVSVQWWHQSLPLPGPRAGSQLSPRKEALTTEWASQKEEETVVREKCPGPQQSQISVEEEARTREKTRKLRRNCKNPAVAKRGLRGECGSNGGSMRGRRGEKRNSVSIKTVPTCTAHSGPLPTTANIPFPSPRAEWHSLGKC